MVHTFPEGISKKITGIMWLEFELTYYDVTVQHISHCTMGTLQELVESRRI